MSADQKREKKKALFPLHPAVVERIFYPEMGWEKCFDEAEMFKRGKQIQPAIGTSVAHVLRFMRPMFNATRVLELGTCIGYSAHVLAEIVGKEGQVFSVERDPELAKAARENLRASGMADRVAILQEEAVTALERLKGPFDLILIDVDKSEYVDILPQAVERLAVGGHMIVDDVSFLSRDFPNRLKHLSLHMARFVQMLMKRKDMETIYIPLGDGIVVSRKIESVNENQLNMFVKSDEADKSVVNRKFASREKAMGFNSVMSEPVNSIRREEKEEPSVKEKVIEEKIEKAKDRAEEGKNSTTSLRNLAMSVGQFRPSKQRQR